MGAYQVSACVLQVQQALAHKVWSMRIGASDAALQELRNMGRDEGFSHKYSMMMVSQTSAQPALPGSHSRESSCNAAAEQGTQAASLQQVILHGEAGPHDIKGARGGSSFTSSIWQGQASSNSSLSDLNQLAHVNGTSHEGSHRKSSTVLERIFSSKPVQAPGKADLSNGELQTSFSDTRSVKDSDTPKHAQHDGTAVQPQHSGGSWDSTVQVQGPLPSKSSAASGLHHGDASSTISSILHRPGDDRHSSTNGSRFWSAANIARRISAFGKSGPSYGKSSVFGADQQPMQLLKLAIRIGIATGPLPYGCDVSNCAVKDRAKGRLGVLNITDCQHLQVYSDAALASMDHVVPFHHRYFMLACCYALLSRPAGCCCCLQSASVMWPMLVRS